MFGEKETEKIKGQELPVWQSPKYLIAKKKAVEMIESGKYNLEEGDFWILMNTYSGGEKMMYTGLILSHNGCLKINDTLEDKLKFDPTCVQIDCNGYKNELVFTYINKEQGIYEVGEVSTTNCKNEYPYAMALKRCMDRVILKNCKLAYSGVYSDSEAEEFKEPEENKIAYKLIDKTKIEALKMVAKNKGITEEQLNKGLEHWKYKNLEEVQEKDYMAIYQALCK